MSPQYITDPPLPLWSGPKRNVRTQLSRILKSFWRILWQSIVPFNPRPAPPVDPPEIEDIDDKQVDQCQKIFDEVEASREYLEQKARATFTMVAFLTPLLASLSVFAFGRVAPHSTLKNIFVSMAAVSFACLLLGFLSATRAVGVHTREGLGLKAVIDFEGGKFRKYDRAFRARGLLYCASVNQAMNDHIAQFVKGAQILTAMAIFLFAGAAVCAAALTAVPPPPARTEISGPVAISSADLIRVERAIDKLGPALTSAMGEKARDEQRLDRAELRLGELETAVHALSAELDRLRAEIPATGRKQ